MDLCWVGQVLGVSYGDGRSWCGYQAFRSSGLNPRRSTKGLTIVVRKIILTMCESLQKARAGYHHQCLQYNTLDQSVFDFNLLKGTASMDLGNELP